MIVFMIKDKLERRAAASRNEQSTELPRSVRGNRVNDSERMIASE